jgi:hypothetical protein
LGESDLKTGERLGAGSDEKVLIWNRLVLEEEAGIGACLDFPVARIGVIQGENLVTRESGDPVIL